MAEDGVGEWGLGEAALEWGMDNLNLFDSPPPSNAARELTRAMVEAIKEGDDERVGQLLASGANPSADDEESNWTMAMWACRGFPREEPAAWMRPIMEGRARCLALLLEAGADVLRPRNMMGWSCAHWAGRDGSPPCLELLHAAGMDLMEANGVDTTPLDLACLAGRADLAERVVELVGRDRLGETELKRALRHASAGGSVASGAVIARVCVEKGMDAEGFAARAPSSSAPEWGAGMRAQILAMRERSTLREAVGDKQSLIPASARLRM